MLQQRIHVDKGGHDDFHIIYIIEFLGIELLEGQFQMASSWMWTWKRPRLEHQKRDPTQKLWRLKLSKSIKIWQKQTLQKHLCSIQSPL